VIQQIAQKRDLVVAKRGTSRQRRIKRRRNTMYVAKKEYSHIIHQALWIFYHISDCPAHARRHLGDFSDFANFPRDNFTHPAFTFTSQYGFAAIVFPIKSSIVSLS
jgi:hypothetical protein